MGGGKYGFYRIQPVGGGFRVTRYRGSYFESLSTGDAYEQFFSHLKL